MNIPNDLKRTFLQIKSETDLENLLEGLFTPKEIQEFSLRIQIVKLLKQGKAQHTIASELGVGVATVTRGAKELQKGRFITVS